MNTADNDRFRVDVEKVIRSQKNKFINNLPKPVIFFLKKLLREKQLNEINDNAVHLKNIDYIHKCLEYMDISSEIFGIENLKKEGRFIFVCNHPLGGVDYFAAVSAISEYHKNVKVIANQILMNVTPLKEMFIPVNVFGKTPEQVKEQIIHLMASDEVQLMTFPAGLVARKINGSLDDGPWHRSFVRHAISYKRDIIPVFIDGENSKKFYRLSNLRKKLGLKFNYELFLLPQELVKKKQSKISVIFGKSISYKTFDSSKSYFEWAQTVKKNVYDLKNKKKA